jgi:two-component system response regulator AlgR
MPQSCPVKIFIVDDETLARERLRSLLGDLAAIFPHEVAGEAANAQSALAFLRENPVDVVLCDIRMPGMDGIELALHLTRLPVPPAVIFTTAYDNFAVQAFELNALDYLMKPVRLQRLLAALQKLPSPQADAAQLAALGQHLRGGGRSHLSCHERGRLLLVPINEVLYLRADLKYVTARTLAREYLLDDTLAQLEQEFPERFLRLHRAVLVAREALAGFEKANGEDNEAYGWALLRGLPEKLPISRRQWATAKAAGAA